MTNRAAHIGTDPSATRVTRALAVAACVAWALWCPPAEASSGGICGNWDEDAGVFVFPEGGCQRPRQPGGGGFGGFGGVGGGGVGGGGGVDSAPANGPANMPTTDPSGAGGQGPSQPPAGCAANCSTLGAAGGPGAAEVGPWAWLLLLGVAVRFRRRR